MRPSHVMYSQRKTAIATQHCFSMQEHVEKAYYAVCKCVVYPVAALEVAELAPPPLGDGLTLSVRVMFANAKF